MSSPLPGDWVDRLVTGSARTPARPGLAATVAVCVGSDERVVLEIRNGQVVGTSDVEAQVELPLTAAQVEALTDGSLSLARAYMRGDVKPVGPSGAIAVVVEVFEADGTWQDLRQ